MDTPGCTTKEPYTDILTNLKIKKLRLMSDLSIADTELKTASARKKNIINQIDLIDQEIQLL